jgi:hypothetical protein
VRGHDSDLRKFNGGMLATPVITGSLTLSNGGVKLKMAASAACGAAERIQTPIFSL